ncbi:MAG: tetratricopeptide repeat protein [Gammaproteobacteria bacterium]|nr:tetratricopeptide repeat protein [Gammaproteobacteria bacterium]
MMQERFLSSEEYDEEAYKLYDEGDYEGALEMLKEGLSLYPHAVELYVGMGYARLAREEYAWARESFQHALILDPDHEDALVGMGELLLRFGKKENALRLFEKVEALGYDSDMDLMLTMGRALYGAGLYVEARDAFARLVASRPDSAEAVAALGYALQRTGNELEATRHIRRALRLAPELHEARVFLGHVLYDRADREGAMREFEQVPPAEHWDSRAVWRVIELNASLRDVPVDDARMEPWQARLRELESLSDPLDRLLAEVEAQASGIVESVTDHQQLELFGNAPLEDRDAQHLRTREGRPFRGTWHEIVRQMRDDAGFSHETVSHYMRRLSERWREQFGLEIPIVDPESFLTAALRAGLVKRVDDGPAPAG